MIRIEGISKEFKEGIGSKRVKAVEDLTLEVNKGEIFGFLAKNRDSDHLDRPGKPGLFLVRPAGRIHLEV